MRPTTWAHAIGAGATLLSVAVWCGTGAEGYTRWPDERLARADAPPREGEEELLADIGFTDDRPAAPQPGLTSRFALGLLPGGLDPRHVLSVGTVTGAALLVSGTTVLIRVRGRPPQSPIAPETRP